MHGRVLLLGTSSAGERISLLCIAGCAAVSGRGYYVAGPVLDVPGRPCRDGAVLARPTGRSEMPHKAPSAPIPRAGISRHAFTRFHTRAADRAHVTYTPSTTWPVNGHTPGSSRTGDIGPVLMPPEQFRRFTSDPRTVTGTAHRNRITPDSENVCALGPRVVGDGPSLGVPGRPGCGERASAFLTSRCENHVYGS